MLGTIGRHFTVMVVIAASVLVAAPAQTASAYCIGSQRASFNSGFGIEDAKGNGTCNGNNVYNGKVDDIATDNSCVWVVARINGIWQLVNGWSCANFVNFSFSDGNGISAFYLCRSSGCSIKVTNSGF